MTASCKIEPTVIVTNDFASSRGNLSPKVSAINLGTLTTLRNISRIFRPLSYKNNLRFSSDNVQFRVEAASGTAITL
jgi:hypothetical protein